MAKIGLKSSSFAGVLIVGFMGYIMYHAWSADKKSYEIIALNQFETLMERKDFTLVNVHTPYQGEIKGTDLLIPYNAIYQNKSKLPQNRDAKIVVYCMGDHMGYAAADQLVKMGYTRIFNLQGGMLAWQKKGKRLVHRQSLSRRGAY